MAEATDGEVPVEVLWNILDEGRPATDLLDMVAAGELTFCYFSSSYIGKTVPELDVLEIPFLFGSLADAHAALDGDLGAALNRATEQTTPFTVLGYWDNGFRHFTNRIRPVRSPADVAGMTVRLQPNAIHESMIRAWGGTPVPAELSKGIALIASLEVDAQENPLANTVAYGVDAVHHHVTMSAHLYGARGLYANPASLAALSDDIAAAVRAAARSAIRRQRQAGAAKEVEIRADLEDRGLQFVDLSDAERAEFRAATARVIADARAAVGDDLVDLARRS
jgi:C4-dicarboxylate-binding protein DctP